MRWTREPTVAGLLATLLVSALAFGSRSVSLLEPLENVERWSLDLRFQLRGAQPTSGQVVIVAFDDRTQAESPDLLVKRAAFAQVIRAVHEAGASAIGVDAFFGEPEALLPRALSAQIAAWLATHPEDSEAHALLADIAEVLAGDAVLRDAIEDAQNVVLALHVGAVPRASAAHDVTRSSYGQLSPGRFLPSSAESVFSSMPLLTKAARAQGMVTLYTDPDQTIREMPAGRQTGGRVTAPLSVQLLAIHDGVGRGGTAYVADAPEIRIGRRQIPITRDGILRLNFRGPARSFPTYSAVDVLQHRIPPDALRDRIVLLGFTHLGHDTTRTPFGPLIPGVELHATAIDNLLRGDVLRRAAPRHDVMLTLCVGVAISLLFTRRWALRMRTRLLGLCGLAVAVAGFAYVVFAAWNGWVSFVGPLLGFLVVTPLCLAMGYVQEGLERRRTRKAFSHYLAEDLITQLLASPQALRPGGSRRDLTVLFSDIRGFTTFSEELSPEGLVQFLNAYLGPMTRAVLEHGGYLDKYIGDAIMAVFGAPVTRPEHASMALEAAMAMHQTLTSIPSPRPGHVLEIGLGINSGEMFVGNLGSEQRFDYTVIGDAVNLGSRLEGLTKIYGVFCIVGQATRHAAAGHFEFRQIDRVRVKGRTQPVAIFEFLGTTAYRIQRYQDEALFETALRSWQEGRFSEARADFQRFADWNPRDGVAHLYLERLQRMGEHAPPNWDAVFTHHEK